MNARVLAMMLLFGNGIPEDTTDLNTVEIREACRKLAIEQEWLDDREVIYSDEEKDWQPYKLFTNEAYFADEVTFIQKRRQDLEDCPNLAENNFFHMSAVYIQDCKNFNESHLKWLEGAWLLNTDRRVMYREAIDETKFLYNVYCTLAIVKSDSYYVVERRLALRKIKNLIGKDSYYGITEFPPCVPFWRFRDVDK